MPLQEHAKSLPNSLWNPALSTWCSGLLDEPIRLPYGPAWHDAVDRVPPGPCPGYAIEFDAQTWMDKVVGDVRAVSTGGKLVAFDAAASTMTLEVGDRQLTLKLSAVMFDAVQEFLGQIVDVVVEQSHGGSRKPSDIWVVELGRATKMPKSIEGDLDAVLGYFRADPAAPEADLASEHLWEEYHQGGVVAGFDRDRSSIVLETTGQRTEIRVPPDMCGEVQRVVGQGVRIRIRGKYMWGGSRYSSVAVGITLLRNRPKHTVEDFRQTFGCFREELSDPAIQEYFRTLRGAG